MTENTTKKTVSRRAVAGGIAWSVPAIALASAAPAAATSPLIDVELSTGNACKYPGNGPGDMFHAYRFPLTVKNITGETVCVTITSGYVIFTGQTQPAGSAGWYSQPPRYNPENSGTPAPSSVCIPAGGSVTIYYIINRTGSSGNTSGTAYGSFLATGQSTGRQSEASASTTFPNLPPCSDLEAASGSAPQQSSATESSAVETTAPAAESAAPETAAPAEAATSEAAAPAAPSAEPVAPETAVSAATEAAAPAEVASEAAAAPAVSETAAPEAAPQP